MVYVLSIEGNPLMPTNNAKARILLKKKKAIVKTIKPFTIQLTYVTTNDTQDITLGIDPGYANIGFSALSEKKEFISGEVKLLSGISNRITEKSTYRRFRRQSLRYRKPKFDNRKIPKGKLAPSTKHKLDSTIRFINKMKGILPITRVIIEVANFDIQKIKNPDIEGKEYQEGEQFGFWNLREYILHRDNHKCQNPNCKNKDTSPILVVHHIVYLSNGGTNIPSNLITLCTKCHTLENHKEGKFLYLWQTNKPKMTGFKEATFMSIVHWKLVNLLSCNYTYGYITKANRIKHNLAKSHSNDAFVIANGTNQERVKSIKFEQIRRNNRSLERFYDATYIDIRSNEKVKANELNCGRRTRNKNKNGPNLRIFRGPKISKGQRRIRKRRYFYQPNDLVKYLGKVYTVKATQSKGTQVVLNEIKKILIVRFLTPYKFSKGFMCHLYNSCT